MSDEKDNDLDFDNDVFIDCKENKVIEKTYKIYLDSEIEEPNKYRKVIKTLNDATEKDLVILVLNNHGGYLHTANQIYNALKETKAKTIAEIYMAYSAAGLIMLGCQSVRVKRFASFMSHTASYGTYGKHSEIEASVIHTTNILKDQFHEVYNCFMTKKEIDKMIEGVDFYFNEHELKERLKKAGKLIE